MLRQVRRVLVPEVALGARRRVFWALSAALLLAATLTVPVAAAAPANNKISKAHNIASLPFSYSENTNGATLQKGEPDGCVMGGSVWFKITPAHDEAVVFDTSGSNFDSAMQIFSGTTLSNMSYMACAQDWQDSNAAVDALTLHAGVHYVIQVGGQEGATGTLQFAARLATVPNDNFASATTIISLPDIAQQWTLAATLEPGEPEPSCQLAAQQSVWFDYTPTATQLVNLSTTPAFHIGANYNTVIAVFTGSTLASLSEIACNDDYDDLVNSQLTAVTFTAGVTYHIQVSGNPKYGSSGFLGFCIVPTANDLFATATTVDSLPFSVSESTDAFDVEAGENNHNPCDWIGGTAWFKFTPPADGSYVFDTAGSVTMNELVLWATSPDGLIMWTCRDALPGASIQLGVELAGGETYYIQMGSQGSPKNRRGGDLHLAVSTADDLPSGGAPSAGLPGGVSPTASYIAQETAPYPAAVDLRQWAPPVGWQGLDINSCTQWAIGYYYRYWLRDRALGTSPTFAPMFLYSQVGYGQNVPTQASATIALLQSAGVAPLSDYPSTYAGEYLYGQQPTSAEMSDALNYRVTGSTLLFAGPASTGKQQAIEAALAGGKPVVIGLPVYSSFAVPDSQGVIGLPPSGEQPRFNHAVFVAGYDSVGVWIENSWGTSWGLNGWAKLSWDYLNAYAYEAWTMNSIDGASSTTSDDFSSYSAGSVPSSWLLRGTNGMSPAISEIGGSGPSHRVLSFPAVSNQLWDRWAINSHALTGVTYTTTVELDFASNTSDRAGLTVGWDDASLNRIDVQANAYWDDIEFHSHGLGSNYTVTGSGAKHGGLKIQPNTKYWLRAHASKLANGNGQIVVSWSTDGSHFSTVMTIQGPALGGDVLKGMVGVGTAGPNMPQVWFDNFSLKPN